MKHVQNDHNFILKIRVFSATRPPLSGGKRSQKESGKHSIPVVYSSLNIFRRRKKDKFGDKKVTQRSAGQKKSDLNTTPRKHNELWRTS